MQESGLSRKSPRPLCVHICNTGILSLVTCRNLTFIMEQTKPAVQYSLVSNGDNTNGHADSVDKAELTETKRPFKTLFCIICWYTSNIGVIILNKYLISIHGYRLSKKFALQKKRCGDTIDATSVPVLMILI